MSIPPTLHILSLAITNNGIIEAMHIEPKTGKPVVLAGTNGAGKTTALNAIESILSDAKIAIRKGEDKATVKMELSEPGDTQPIFQIKRTVTDRNGKKGDALEILDKDGKQISSPRKFIDELIGSGAALDPTEIMQPRPGEKPETFAKRQADTLMERLGIKSKAEKLDETIKTLMDTRKNTKADLDSAQARVDAIVIPKGTPDTAVDVVKLSEKIRGLDQIIRDETNHIDHAARMREAEVKAEREVAELEQKLVKAQTALLNAKSYKETAVKAMEAAISAAEKAKPALEKLKTELATANQTNAAVQDRKTQKDLKTEVTAKQAKVDSYTKQIEDARDARLNLVKEAKIPVAGLVLTDAGLFYNGISLQNESQGNRARVCALLAVSETSVRAKILMLREGSLISKENRQIVYDIAQEKGWQVWEERFAEVKPKDGLWIVAGELKE